MGDINLQAVYRRSEAGDVELKTPGLGLSLNQRKLLQWVDGDTSVITLSDKLAAGHTVDTEKVVRDIEKLETAKLIVAVGAGVSGAAGNAGNAKKRGIPVWAYGAGVAIAVIAGVGVFSGRQKPVETTSATGQPVAAAETESQDDGKILGVMPSPSRWFAPADKKPDSVATGAPKPATDKAKPVVAATPVKPLPTVAAQVSAPAAPIVAQAPVSSPAPVQQIAAAPASVTATLPKPEAPKQPVIKLVSSVAPEFPAEAARGDISSGTVRARMNINEAGQVVKVDILEARPRRVFDRAVVAALSKWRYEPTGEKFTVEKQIDFSENN